MRRKATLLTATVAALAAMLVVATPGGAATLHLRTDGYYLYTDVLYTGAAGEANHLVVGGQGGHVVLLRDPNIPISAAPFAPPYVDANPNDGLFGRDGELPVYAGFSCSAPTGRGHAMCVATPGSTCNEGGCQNDNADLWRFHVAYFNLGDGNDSITLLPASMASTVFAGSGGDTLDTRNKVSDYIDCGDGADVVTADKSDRVASTCETVTRG
jgi:hypothetical protein